MRPLIELYIGLLIGMLLAFACLLAIIAFLIDVVDDDCISCCNFPLRIHNLRNIQFLSVALETRESFTSVSASDDIGRQHIHNPRAMYPFIIIVNLRLRNCMD